MSKTTKAKHSFAVTAYRGDFKTLLAFDLADGDAKGLAGFTIQAAPQDGKTAPYYLLNTLCFPTPKDAGDNAAAAATSSLDAPFQKFRWLHVPGQFHQGMTPFEGPYAYTVTPRYFAAGSALAPLDASKSVTVTVDVMPFTKNGLSLGFTRGFTQSQAFVHHFGANAVIRPPNLGIDFDTDTQAGASTELGKFTYAQEYEWLGGTARATIFAFLDAVMADASLSLDVFAYDLNEPDICQALLKLAAQRRMQMVLDDAPLHHNAKSPTLEDLFERAFVKAYGSGGAKAIVRGKFSSFAHDKCFIVKNASGKGVRVLTGSTNFSVTGMYVNSNHVLIFDDPNVAEQYRQVFAEAFDDGCTTSAFIKTPLSMRRFNSTNSPGLPATSITFAPHTKPVMRNVLGEVVSRIEQEVTRRDGSGSVLFAVMDVGTEGQTPNMVEDVLRDLHKNSGIYTYGITDTTSGIELYKRGSPDGVLVTGKPYDTVLPPPFDQVPNIKSAAAHQVHHKFVVCGFNGPDPTIFCGSSNLAEGGEQHNGDNLLEIHDADVAACFAIEALGLIDHFDFLDKVDVGKSGRRPSANMSRDAADAEVFLDATDSWAKSYFDPSDLHYKDRRLFGGVSSSSR